MKDTTIRELFVEELAEVTGGSGDPLEKVRQAIQEIRDGWNTTQACCEEGQCCDYWA